MYKYEAELVPTNSSNTKIQPVEVTPSPTPTKSFSSFGNEKREHCEQHGIREIRKYEERRNVTKRNENENTIVARELLDEKL